MGNLADAALSHRGFLFPKSFPRWPDARLFGLQLPTMVAELPLDRWEQFGEPLDDSFQTFLTPWISSRG
jgi:hypothetical protein